MAPTRRTQAEHQNHSSHVRGVLRAVHAPGRHPPVQITDGPALQGDLRTTAPEVLLRFFLHVDETEITLQTGKGYVWVFTNLEEVVFMYRPNREGNFLQDLLKDFRGVLVSDFYSAYDSVACTQQKCLIHLMRDMNQELLNSPSTKNSSRSPAPSASSCVPLSPRLTRTASSGPT